MQVNTTVTGHTSDNVNSHAIGLATGKPGNGGFQLYTACPAILVAPIPSNVSYTDASVLPLALSTAAAGLYQEKFLELPFPSATAKPSGKVIVVWGGSSSVGSTAMQLCAGSGVDVVATASAKNHEYCKRIGASHVVDYNSASVVDDVVARVKATGKEFAGIYDSISLPESMTPCIEILQKVGGSKNMATVLPPPEDAPKDLNLQSVFAITVASNNVGDAVWQMWVPGALKDGSLKCLPEPLVVGKGLESVQKGLDVQRKGVSAKKVVIDL